MATPTVTLAAIIKHLDLKVNYTPDDPEKLIIQKKDVTRPGLPLAGFYDIFDADRIQVVGLTEDAYIESLDETKKREHLEAFFSRHPIAVVCAHNIHVSNVAEEMAEKYGVPLLSTEQSTSELTSALISYLNLQLAPMITRHGVLIEIYGEGVFITGDSGVGKSETAIELIKRGHRLIADDAVELRKVSAITILGQAPEIIRHYIELRGIGIVDVRRLFGMGSVKLTEKINLVVHLEHWEKGKMYERLGLDETYTDIMGVQIPSLTIPVQPGRNLAVVIETAAMNNRQKKMGYNTAKEFNEKVMRQMGLDPNAMA